MIIATPEESERYMAIASAAQAKLRKLWATPPTDMFRVIDEASGLKWRRWPGQRPAIKSSRMQGWGVPHRDGEWYPEGIEGELPLLGINGVIYLYCYCYVASRWYCVPMGSMGQNCLTANQRNTDWVIERIQAIYTR